MEAKDTVMNVGEMDDYNKASSYLIGVALSTGDGFMLRAIKSLMDNNDKSFKAGAVNERARIIGYISEKSKVSTPEYIDKNGKHWRGGYLVISLKDWQALKEETNE